MEYMKIFDLGFIPFCCKYRFPCRARVLIGAKVIDIVFNNNRLSRSRCWRAECCRKKLFVLLIQITRVMFFVVVPYSSP